MLLIRSDYVNYNVQGAFVIIFFICSDLLDCFWSVCTIAMRTKNDQNRVKVISTMKILTGSSHFCCFDVFPVRPPQNFQVQAIISTIGPVLTDYIPVSCDYVLPSPQLIFGRFLGGIFVNLNCWFLVFCLFVCSLANFVD